MLALHDHCRTAADVRAAIAASRAWRREIWGTPTPVERPVPRYHPWAISGRSAAAAQTTPSKLPFGRVRTVDIIDAACALWRIDRAVLLGRSRKTEHVIPRQAAMATARRLTGESYPLIGHRMGGFDHTTIIHAVRKADQDGRLQAAIEQLMAALPTGDAAPAEDGGKHGRI